MHDEFADLSPSPTAKAAPPDPNRPLGRRRMLQRLVGAGLAVVLVLYLALLFFTIPRYGLGYTYIHFLFDYHFGVTRRALEGEIARHLFPPPYWIGNFRDFSHWMLGLAMVLFVGIAVAIGRRRRTAGWLLLLLVIATSPLTFKQMIGDEGRQDIFGIIVLEITFLLTFLRSPAPAVYFLSIVLLPLTLVNENHLLLTLPSSLAILMAKVWTTPGRRPLRWVALPWSMFVAGFVVNLLLPPPRVPYEQYEAYLASKSVHRLGEGTPDRWLYTHVKENLDFAAREWHRLAAQHWHHAADYLVFFAITIIVAALVWIGARKVGGDVARSYLWALGFIGGGYVVLCRTASDEARWLANFGTCVLFVSLFWCDTFRIRPAKAYPLAFIAMFQLMLHASFGITVADLNLTGRFTQLVAFYRGDAATRPAAPAGAVQAQGDVRRAAP